MSSSLQMKMTGEQDYLYGSNVTLTGHESSINKQQEVAVRSAAFTVVTGSLA